VSWPDVIAPVHEFDPVYVPVIDDDEACASPDTVAAHDSYGRSNPPAWTLIEKCIEEPVTVPDTEPRPPAPVLPSDIVKEPENDVPCWVSCHVICPGPHESFAQPLHVPVTSSPDAGSGPFGDPQPAI
jgi:hypothetical protein